MKKVRIYLVVTKEYTREIEAPSVFDALRIAADIPTEQWENERQLPDTLRAEEEVTKTTLWKQRDEWKNRDADVISALRLTNE